MLDLEVEFVFDNNNCCFVYPRAVSLTRGVVHSCVFRGGVKAECVIAFA